MVSILVADSDPHTRACVASCVDGRGAAILDAGADEARKIVEADEADLVVADLRAPGLGGTEFVEICRRRQVPVILVDAFGSVEDAVAAMRSGAADVVSKPFSAERLAISIERSLEKGDLVRQNRDLREALDDRLRIDNFISTDPQMHAVLKSVRAVAPTRTTVLITGESGTGKTLLARAIHGASDRRGGPFVEVNCGALPDSLLEPELFGHERGAFTGAVKTRAGKFEAADGGTIFLDEIGTASAGMQVKLLRVLQDRQIERVGGTETRTVDVRVVLATNLDLAKAVERGDFREDLYYRINVVPLHVPPLRERRGDVPALAEHFLERFAAEHGKPAREFSEQALAALVRAPWPGNVRQLENVVERAVVLSESPTIRATDFATDLSAGPDPADGIGPESLLAPDAHLLPLKEALEGPERTLIARTLEHFGGNRQRTAESLGINRSTLFNKMRKFGML